MNWHHLFGLLLTDFFAGSAYIVELEKDLSLKKQLLDVVILRKGTGRFNRRLPDGFDNLANHNLITFKSHQEALDDWALKELTGHYVNYRKQASPPRKALLPEEEFRLYAVCSRYPQKLASVVAWRSMQRGVYECRRGTDVINVIVAHQLPRTENNALLHLLSATPDQVRYGASHYQQRSPETSTLLDQVFMDYEHEGLTMPYTMEDFRRDYLKEHLKDLTPEERLKGLPAEERLKGLTPEAIEKYLKRLQQRTPRRKRKKRPDA